MTQDLAAMVQVARADAARQRAIEEAAHLPTLSEIGTLANLKRRFQLAGTERQTGLRTVEFAETWQVSFRPEPGTTSSHMATEARIAGHRVILEGLGMVRRRGVFNRLLTRDHPQVIQDQEWWAQSAVSLTVYQGEGEAEEEWAWFWGGDRSDQLGDGEPHSLRVIHRQRAPLAMGRGQPKAARALAAAWAERNPGLTARIEVDCWTRSGKYGRLGHKTRALRFKADGGRLVKE